MARQFIVSILVILVCLSIYPDSVTSDSAMSKIYPTDYSDCEFPFTYKGKNYTNCTTDGDNGDVKWCSLTTDYVGMFTYCYDFFNTTLACKATYTINGKDYSGCSVISKTSKYKQCKTDNPDYPIIYCPDAKREAKKAYKKRRRLTCNKGYLALSKDHTMCFAPSYFAVPVNLTNDDKQSLLDKHNEIRALVTSAYMFKLYWDDELAKLAQARSDMCVFDHDLAQNRLSTEYNWKNGQNMVWSTEIRIPLADLIERMLLSEKVRFAYGVGCNGTDGTCLHYTQAMISNMTRMGCAVTHCLYPDHIDRYLTCNYILSQYASKYMVPYVESKTAASSCPAKAKDGLCDCGNKICKFDAGEYIEPNTCECNVEKRKRSLNKRQADTSNVDKMASPSFDKSMLSKRSLNKRQAGTSNVDKMASPGFDKSMLSKRSIAYFSGPEGTGNARSQRSIAYFSGPEGTGNARSQRSIAYFSGPEGTGNAASQ